MLNWINIGFPVITYKRCSQFRYEDNISSLPRLNFASKFPGRGCHPGMPLKIIKSAGTGVLKTVELGLNMGSVLSKLLQVLKILWEVEIRSNSQDYFEN